MLLLLAGPVSEVIHVAPIVTKRIAVSGKYVRLSGIKAVNCWLGSNKAVGRQHKAVCGWVAAQGCGRSQSTSNQPNNNKHPTFATCMALPIAVWGPCTSSQGTFATWARSGKTGYPIAARSSICKTHRFFVRDHKRVDPRRNVGN